MRGIAHKHGELTGDDALTTALTDDSPVTRIMARGAAADWLPAFTDWVNAEINLPRAVPSQFLHALAILQLQTFASLAAQLINADGEETLIRIYIDLAETTLREHMAATRDQTEDMS